MSRHDFDQIRAELIDSGFNVAATAKKLGKNRETVTRCLRHGYPSLGLAPVRPDAAPAPISPTPTPAPSGLAAIIPIRTPQENAIHNNVQNSIGTSVAISRLLSKLVEQAPTILAKLTGTGEDAISPREYLAFVRDIARANAASSKALQATVQASRMDSGSPSAVHQHVHLTAGAGPAPGSVAPLATAERSPEEQSERMLHLARSIVRLSAPVEYDGEETGIVDEDDDGEAVG